MAKPKKRDYTIKIKSKKIDDGCATLEVEMCADAWKCLQEKQKEPLCRLVIIAL